MHRAVLLAALATSLAHADALRATREQPMFEVSHTVDIRIENGVATYKVRRMFANPGKVADEAGLAIDLPYGAAATGLRIRAHDTWYDGELMEREQAAKLYHELTGFAAYRPKDPALLQWLWADKLYLQVFPVMPGQISTVEYTLTVPTRYEHGRYWLSYPRVDAAATAGQSLALATPIVTVHPMWGDVTTPIAIDGKRVAPDMPIVLAPPVREPWADATEQGASYVASTLVVPPSKRTDRQFAKATVTLDIKHTYKSDLRVELLTPDGKRVMLHNGTGGGENNIIGKFPVALPPNTTGTGTWRLVVSDHAALDTGTIDGWSLSLDQETTTATDTPIFIPDAPETANDAGVAAIAIAPPAIDTWTARLGRVVASSAHAFARLEVDVAPELRPAPKHAQVVFVIDASYSIGEAGLAAQLDVIRAYLSHVPDAEIELVAYRRHATRVFGKLVAASAFDAELASHRIALGNGSALDEGARLAARVLADRKGPRRVVLVTDELLRPALSDGDALAALAGLSRDTVVHVIVPHVDGPDRPDLQRNDQARLAPLATHHHGILVDLHGLPVQTVKEIAPPVLELVRPTRIDQLAVDGVHVEDTLLHEGDGLRVMVADKSAPTSVVLTGKLWSDPIRREVDATAAFSRQTAAFVFGSDEHSELSQDEMMKVAIMGRAVSPVTSYVAFEPGTRPSTVGLERQLGGSGFGSGHGGMAGTRVASSSTQVDLRTLVDVAACVRTSKPAANWSVGLDVETTKDEIVDVIITSGAGPMATCLAEAMWSVRLDTAMFSADHESFQLAFR